MGSKCSNCGNESKTYDPALDARRACDKAASWGSTVETSAASATPVTRRSKDSSGGSPATRRLIDDFRDAEQALGHATSKSANTGRVNFSTEDDDVHEISVRPGPSSPSGEQKTSSQLRRRRASSGSNGSEDELVRTKSTASARSTRSRSEPAAARPAAARQQKRRPSLRLVAHTKGGIDGEYDVGDMVGEGTEGTVFRAARKKTGIMRAIKKVPKKSQKQQQEIEIEIMKKMDHPNIVKLFETFEDRGAIYMVMELCLGGELFDRVVEQGRFSEREAAIVLQEILRAVNYLHSYDIVHRDLKPENFIFSNKAPIGEENVLKLIDFGIACECKPGAFLRDLMGTPYYTAPQVVAGKYDRQCDMWSVGVIMFTLLSGEVPFNGPSDKEVLAKVREGVVRYGETWDRVSEDGRNLLKGLLTRNPKERMTSEDALNHDWIFLHAPQAEMQLQDDVGILDGLRHFRRRNKLKQAALSIVANEMDDQQIAGLRETFTALDVDGDGLLTLAEIEQAIDEAGVKCPLLDAADGNLVMDYTEFLAATISKRHELTEEACRVAFGMFDVDGNGKITAKSITRAFATQSKGGAKDADRFGIKHRESQDIIDRYADEDGEMDFAGFQKMMLAPDFSPPARVAG